MATIGEIEVRIDVDSDGFGQAMKQAQSDLDGFGRNLHEISAGIGVAFAAVGAAIALGLGFAVKKAADFEAQIDRVGAIAGATESDLERLRQTALQLGASTSKSATEVAEGMEMMAAMGFEVNEVIAAMPGVIAAAEASGESMALVTETVAAALNSFGLEAKEASRVADVLAQAANDSAASIEDMQYAFKYAAPIARQVGMSLEQLAAAVEILTNAGMRGEQAGTTLRMALIRLADPPKEAKKTLDQLGISVTDSKGKFLPFSKIIEQFSKKLRGMSDAQKLAAVSTIFGTEAASGMLNIIDAGPEKLDKLTKSLENSAGASQKAAQQMKNNLKGSLEELQGAFETLQITVGTHLAPAIRFLADGLQNLLNAFNALPESVQKFLSIGAAILSILLIIGAAAAFAAWGLGALHTAFGVSIGTIAAWIGGIIGGIAAIFAIGAALVYAYERFEGFRNVVNTAWAAIKEGFQAVVNFLRPAVQAVVEFVLQQWGRIKNWWSQSGGAILEAARNVWNGITTVISGAISIIQGIFQTFWPAIQDIVRMTWEGIKDIIEGAIGMILSIIDIFASLLTGNWTKLWESLKNLVASAWQTIWGVIQVWAISKIVSLIVGWGARLLAVIRNAWSAIWTTISNIVSRIWSWITVRFNAIRAFITRIWNAVRSVAFNIWGAIAALIIAKINEIKNAISRGFTAAKNIVSNIVNRIANFLGGLASQAFSWGRNLISSFASGISSMARAVVSKAKQIASSVKSYLGFSSPTEKGPGRTSDKWAPNLMNMFARGIEAGIPRLRLAVAAASSVIAELNQSPHPGTSGGIQNNTFNIYANNQPTEKAIANELRRLSFLYGL